VKDIKESEKKLISLNNMFRIEKLTKELLEKHIDAICGAETRISQSSHGQYERPWTIENFLKELPEKWTYSRIIFSGNDVIGFYIASLKNTSDGNLYLHGHRTGVLPEHRSSTIFLEINSGIINEAKQNGIHWFTGFVADSNKEVLNWDLRVLGYKIIKDKEKLSYFLGNNADNYTLEADGKMIRTDGTELDQYFLVKEI
jgi:hypothetical protein